MFMRSTGNALIPVDRIVTLHGHDADPERPAWVPRPEFNEMDYPVVYDVPHPVVLHALQRSRGGEELGRNIPASL